MHSTSVLQLAFNSKTNTLSQYQHSCKIYSTLLEVPLGILFAVPYLLYISTTFEGTTTTAMLLSSQQPNQSLCRVPMLLATSFLWSCLLPLPGLPLLPRVEQEHPPHVLLVVAPNQSRSALVSTYCLVVLLRIL